MMDLRLTVIVLCLGAVALTGCGKSTTGEATGPRPSTGTASVPATLFAASAPENAVSLIEAKTAAKPGDRVVFEARIGGRREPFVANRAVFFVADASLQSCDQLPGDTCRKPWDYCCEPPDNLLKHMATVQVVDAGGQPLEVLLQDEQGMAPLRTVYVSGTVELNDDAGNFVVNAERIYAKEG